MGQEKRENFASIIKKLSGKWQIRDRKDKLGILSLNLEVWSLFTEADLIGTLSLSSPYQ